MTFNFDTGEKYPDIIAVSAVVEPGQVIRFTNYGQAHNKFNRISENIGVHELVEQLDAYWDAESPVIEALERFAPDLHDALCEQYEDQRIMLEGSEEWEARNG